MLLVSESRKHSRLWTWIVMSVVVGTGCSSSTDSKAGAVTSAGLEIDGSTVVATIDDTPVTMSEIEEKVGDRLASMDFQYRSQRHQLIDRTLKELVRDRLFEKEAQTRKTSVDAMLSTETSSIEVSTAEAAEWYENNKARVGERPLEQVLPQIQQFLAQQRRGEVVAKLAKELEEKSKVVYRLEPMRADIDIEGSPARGPADAPVTIVEFSDFECGYCARLVHTLWDVEDNYEGKVRIVFRQFPLNMHPNAFKAAEAALCAGDQGKFWVMHDLLFREQSQLGVVALKEKASRLGIDRSSFDSCLDSGRHAEKVQKDLRDGAAVGVTGTPALFVNGIPVLGGAVPYEVLSGVIDEELERLGAR